MLETAKAAALKAGKIQMDNYGKTLNVDAKLKNDIKLEVDKLSEKAIISTILEKFPTHSILGEEGGSIENNSEYLWIIDPLDGTVNYYYGIPYFCTSIACYKIDKNRTELCKKFSDLGEPICAAIYAGPTNELIYAETGKGAFLNDTRIHASTENNLEECYIVTGFGISTDEDNSFFTSGYELAKKVRKIRCLGAAAYDIANVAAGRATGFYEKSINTWDIAAGALIAQEAGATIEAYEYEKGKWHTVIAGANITSQLAAII